MISRVGMTCAFDLDIDATSNPTTTACPSQKRFLASNSFTVTYTLHATPYPATGLPDFVAFYDPKAILTEFSLDYSNISRNHRGNNDAQNEYRRVTMKQLVMSKHMTDRSVPVSRNRKLNWKISFVLVAIRFNSFFQFAIKLGVN